MNAGRIEQTGPPAEIYERPATRFVAEFIGRTNLFAGTALGATGVRLHSGTEVRIDVPPEIAPGSAVHVDVALVVINQRVDMVLQA